MITINLTLIDAMVLSRWLSATPPLAGECNHPDGGGVGAVRTSRLCVIVSITAAVDLPSCRRGR
jgi:hypothetical protein